MSSDSSAFSGRLPIQAVSASTSKPMKRALFAPFGQGNFGAGGAWTGAQVHEVKCEPERCTVRLRVAAKVQAPPFTGQELVTYLEEVWVRDEGQWWFFQAF